MIKKSLLLTLLLAFMAPWAANAYNHQVQVGDGTSGQNIAPINLYYNYSYTQQIYTAAQINGDCSLPGDIESISFYYAGSVAKTVPITVFMKTTEKTSFSSTTDWETVTENDIVFNGDWEIPSTAGWVTITLNAPFAYDGESNLLIAIDKGYYSNYTNQNWRYTAVTNDQVIQYRSDSTDPNPYSPTTASGTSKNLPNIMFNMTIAHPAPSALTVDEVALNTATISWTAPTTTNTITGYAYEYTDGETIETGTTTGTTANLTELTAATDYLFQVKAIYSDGESCWSEALDFTTLEACMTPENLSITNVTAHTADLTWTEGFGDGQWVLQYKLSTEEEYTNSVNVALADLPYTLTGLTAESTYNVQIAPVCDATKTLTGNFTTTVACFAPTNLAVEANVQTATFTWESDVNDYEIAHATVATADPNDNIVGTATENTYSMSNLTIDANHYFWVRSNCGSEGYSSWAGPVSVHIGYCIPNPTSHDGKGITGVSFGIGDYIVTNGDGSASLPASAPFYGNYSSMIGAVQAGVESTIAITTSTGSFPYTFVIWVDFDNSLSFEDSEVVYIGKASSGNGTFNATITIPATQELGDYRMRIYGADSYFTSFYNSGNTNWEAAHDPCSSGSYRHAHDYTLRVLEAPSCMTPTDLTVSNVTAHEATITWTSDADAWQICVNDDEENPIDVTETTYNFTGLDAETTYTIKVRANCGDDGYSDWTTVNFTTDVACPAPTGFAVAENGLTGHTATLNWQGTSNSYQVAYRTIAYVDGVEEGFASTSAPEGWTRYNTLLTDDVLNGTTALTTYAGGWNFGTSNGVFDSHARVNIYGSSCKYWLVTPTLTVPAGATLSFDLALTAYSGSNVPAPQTTGSDDRFIVLVSTDNMETWTILREWNNSGSTYVYNNIANTATGENVSIDITTYVGQDVRIAFYGESTESNADNYLHLDNVAIGIAVPAGEMQYASNITEETVTLQGLLAETEYEAWLQGDCGSEGLSTEVGPISFTTDVACPAPANVQVTNISAYAATLSWTGSSESYNVEYRPAEIDKAGEWVIVTTEDNTIALANLIPETLYEFRIQGNCGDEGNSEYTYGSFTTAEACPMPTNLVAANVKATTADLSWNGSPDVESFTVRYRTTEYYEGGIVEGFESGTMPEGWTKSGPGTWTVNAGYDFNSIPAHDGTYNVRINHGTSGSETFLITPMLDFSGETNPTLSFWYINYGWSGDVDEIHVYYRVDEGEWVELWNTTEEHQEWTESGAIALPNPSANYQIGFSMVDKWGHGVGLDDIVIGNPIFHPTGEWQTASTTEMNVTLTDLTPETPYEAQVKSDCSDPEEWSTAVSFTTPDGQIFTKTINGYGEGSGNWYLIATPIGIIAPASVTNMITDPVENYDLFAWDGATTEVNVDNEPLVWRNFKEGEYTHLEPGKGYLYANKNNVTLSFIGTPYTGNGIVDLTYDAENESACLNLVGNPYAETATIDGNRSFYTMNSDGDKFIATTNNTIEAMEGIFVVAVSAGDQLTFSTIEGAIGGEPIGPDKGNLVLNLSHRNALIDRAIVRFDEGGQLPKFQLNPNDTKVYIPQEGKDYAVVRGSEMGEMPVSFKAETNGTYNMSFTAEEVSFNYLHLIDNMTGADVDLLVNPSYTFDAQTTDYASRFKLVFATGSNSDDSFSFYSNGSFVISNEGEAVLQVVDVTGRILNNETINGSANVHVNAAPGVYMLRLINGDNVKVQKVVVR